MKKGVDLFVRWIPESFAVALLLTLFTVVWAVFGIGYALDDTITAWGDSFWNLLTFTNQITLTLLLGYALANTPPVERLLRRMAARIHTARAAYLTACVITGLSALISWGFSLVACGIVARVIGSACRDRGVAVHYPLLVAASFSGFVLWHQGLTSSVALAIASPGHFLEGQIGIIPTSSTLFTGWNLLVVLAVLVSLPPLMARLHPRDPSSVRPMPPESQSPTTAQGVTTEETVGERLEGSRILVVPVLLMALFYLGIHFFTRGRGLELNILNFGFLFIGLAMAGTARRYFNIILEGGRVAAPFLLQYPFYAGIAGIMAESGLAARIIEFFSSIATAATLPLFAFFSAGLLNVFIPSGGGQWAVQGPLMMAAGQETGADLARVAMAVALGDQWTNLIQPLILIPVLAISGLSTRDVMSYTFAALIFTGCIFSVALLF